MKEAHSCFLNFILQFKAVEVYIVVSPLVVLTFYKNISVELLLIKLAKLVAFFY